MRITLIGANGFVGTGLRLFLAGQANVELTAVTRQNYESFKSTQADVTIDASGNSKKFLSDQQPLLDLDLSVVHRLRTLQDFPANLHVHVSSVDVYDNLTSPATTKETTEINVARCSNYGLHKILAEQIVQHYSTNWLVLRLAGMVGPALRKNPIFDILNSQPLRIHPDSQYQFMHTAEVARITWQLIQSSRRNEILNVCGDGLVSPRQIANFCGRKLDLSLLPPEAQPRIVEVNISKLREFTQVEPTMKVVEKFVREFKPAAP